MMNEVKGLTNIRANQLLNQYGRNVIVGRKGKNLFIKFFEQFNNFLTILLLFAAFFSFFISEPVDGSLIVSIVILNGLFGIYQEKKAEESIAALKKMTVTKVRVLRDSKEQEINSDFLVPGDLVFIEEGGKIPADGKVTESVNLEINESALTGESLPIAKKVKDFVYSGTIISKGRGYFLVEKTGMNTKFGHIAQNLSLIEETQTPLQKKLRELTRIIGITGIIISLFVFFISIVEGLGYFPAFLLAVSLAVAVVPEGLPAVMTIILAMGVKKMATKKAIIRKLSAIEALGSITLIATDKTGTLTTNKMKVKEVYVDGKLFENNSLPVLQNHPFHLMLLNGILCSSASLSYNDEHRNYEILGDPTEGALLYLAHEMNFMPGIVKKEWKLVDEKPFDSVSKMMTVRVESRQQKKGQGLKGLSFSFTKGAPESILAPCTHILIGNKQENLSEQKKGEIEKQVDEWAMKGLRVLAFSYVDYADSGKENTFLGLVAIHDAPRPEIVQAVQKAHNAGIQTVMITGDSEQTAEAIGIVAGIIRKGDEVVTGYEIDNYSDQELTQILKRVKIFARTNPFQKHRIVQLYQKMGEIVAVTGDGVNDAIALKQADVGVAMGLVGTDVARETADMVITDDNFATIVNAVEEGRNIISHLKNAVKYLLSCNISEAMTLIVGLIAGLPSLLYPIQLLYINLITDGLPALALSFSPKNPRVMETKPSKELVLLRKKEQAYIFLVGTAASIVVLCTYLLYANIYSQDVAFTAVFSVLTLVQSFIFIDLWLSHRSFHRNLVFLNSPLFLSAFFVPFVLQFFVVHTPAISSLFRIAPVSAFMFVQFALLSGLVFVGVKTVKIMVKI